MEKLVKNFDIHNQYLDIITGNILTIEANENFMGWYKMFNDGMISTLVVDNDNLFFTYGDSKKNIGDSVVVNLDKSGDSNRVLNIYDDKELMIKMQYSVDMSLFGIEPFDYIDEEDFDWGVFVSNIINNKQRQKVFIEYFGEKMKNK